MGWSKSIFCDIITNKAVAELEFETELRQNDGEEWRNGMLNEAKRTLAYICPACRQPVIMERSVFQLASASIQLECPCGHSALQIGLQGERVKLTVPCLFCEHSHTATCSTHAFLHEKTLAFSCATSGLDCCYVGEEGPVFEAMTRLEQTVDKLETEAGAQGAFLDEVVMHEVLSELRDIAKRGGISCACGSRAWNLKVKYSSVELSCAECGAMLRIPAAVAEDIDSICCNNKLLIGRKKE